MSAQQPPAGWRALALPGLMSTIGPLLSRRVDGSWRYGLATNSAHANPIGRIHGGVLTSLADHAMTLVAWEAAGRRPVVTVHLGADFLDAAEPGDFLEADVELRRMTGSLLFLETTISTLNRPIAAASAVMKIAHTPQSTPRETSGS